MIREPATPVPGTRAGRPRRARRFGRSRAMRELRRNRGVMVAVVFLFFLLVIAVLAPVVSPYDPDAQELRAQLQGPTGEHLLGTDGFGRDVLSRLIHSSRITLLAVVQALAVAVVLGIPIGLLSGFVPWVDRIVARVADALLSVPPIVLALAVVGVLGPGLTNAMLALGIVMAPSLFRLARSSAATASKELYIEACRSVGCSRWRLIWRHVLPNASSPLLVQVTFFAGVIILAEASLSFLGLGVQPPDSSWGSMLRDAFANIYEAPGHLVAPALMIMLTILAFAQLGDGLRDAFEGRGADGR
ncbi:ABC transporter permease [uncultured Modestobacter sp.]|uniref:ABC transporter permease n=1 Tax=uncultured Modestobacter sp. TaxID=380048 RepID=UPI0026357C29|nr:ABC transporter permease [uncultured Modestobacter sp.]